ncbi:MAG: cation-translocating P-type ATPase, partial [bacterium]
NNDKIETFKEKDKEKISLVNENLANDSLRMLSFGFRYLDKIPHNYKFEDIEKDLIFVGMLGMIDPPRKEVKNALALCKSAGIKSVMITGDHKNTAIAIAKELNMIGKDYIAITGTELDEISDEELACKIDKIEIFTRVSAEHKLRIIKAWKKRNAIIAMTGDGVNDAPALKEADIGIAMGITGTDVTKEAADIVITDDNFASIVSAVEEGRNIYENIKKFIFYLLSCNIGELFLLFFSSILGWPIPLLPIQILWINLITDGLPALALGVEKAEPGLMFKSAEQFKKKFINKKIIIKISILGLMMSISALLIFGYILFIEKGTLIKARTMVFMVLSGSQLFHAFNCRSNTLSIFKLGFLTNKNLVYAVLGSALLQIGIVCFGFTKSIFKVESLNFIDWIFVIILSSISLWIVELSKMIKNKKTSF